LSVELPLLGSNQGPSD